MSVTLGSQRSFHSPNQRINNKLYITTIIRGEVEWGRKTWDLPSMEKLRRSYCPWRPSAHSQKTHWTSLLLQAAGKRRQEYSMGVSCHFLSLLHQTLPQRQEYSMGVSCHFLSLLLQTLPQRQEYSMGVSGHFLSLLLQTFLKGKSIVWESVATFLVYFSKHCLKDYTVTSALQQLLKLLASCLREENDRMGRCH